MLRKFLRTKRNMRLFTSLLLLALVCLTSGCDLLLPAVPSASTATATQTLTPTPTIDWFPATATPTLISQPSATPHPTLADQPAGVTVLLVDDDFSDESLWTTSQSSSGNIAFGNQSLTLAPAQRDVTLFSLSRHPLSADFYLEFTAQTSLCQPEDQFGVIFWRQSLGDYYRLLLNCSGEYRLELVQGSVPTVIHDWEVAKRMQPGAPATNRIGLWLYRGTFQLYINDTFQFEENVAKGREGELGVFARTVTSNAMTVRISDLQIFQVEGK